MSAEKTERAIKTILNSRDTPLKVRDYNYHHNYGFCGTKDKPIYTVKDGKITIKGKEYPIKLKDGQYIIRKLTVNECKRLQTVPEWFEFPVSNSQAYKMLGNGWTVEVIKHLIRSITEGADYEQ